MKKKDVLQISAGSKNNPFSEIILNGDRDILAEVLNKSGYHDADSKTDIDVKILFNDVEISVVDFNTIVESWWDRMGKSIKDEVDYLKTKEAVENRAEEMVKEKLSKLNSMIFDLEQNFDVRSEDY